MPRTAKAIAADIQVLTERADNEGRDWTTDERVQVQGLLDDATAQRDIEQKMKALDGTLPATVFQPGGDSTHGGPGDRFIASKGYLRVKESAGRGQTWTTGPVEVSSDILVKGTMLETGVGGPGGGPVPPMYEPGIVSKLFEPLAVSDVFGQSTTSASQVRYVNEGTATSAAAGVAEGGMKPESTLGMAEVI
jgi:hypothetical protein